MTRGIMVGYGKAQQRRQYNKGARVLPGTEHAKSHGCTCDAFESDSGRWAVTYSDECPRGLVERHYHECPGGHYPKHERHKNVYYCRWCGERMDTNANHYMDGTRVYCGDCMHNSGSSTKGIHAAEYPECPEDWHDMYDHVRTICENRAVARAVMLEEAIA